MAAKLQVSHLDEDTRSAKKTNTSANVMPESSLTIMIMNTGEGSSKYSGDKPTEQRKKAIYDIVTNTGATLVLLQEFRWVDIRSKGWIQFNWPERLQYTSNTDASIMYDINEVTVERYSQKLLDDTLAELQRTGSIPDGFSPFPRMCLRKVNTKGVPVVKFICISWHGKHNKKKLVKLKEFECLLIYVLKLSEKVVLPVIIAGDFNLKIKDIEELVPSTLILHRYTPTERRVENDIIDFYISSKSLVMSKMRALKWESETKVDHVLSLFDHDPVVTSVTAGGGTYSEGKGDGRTGTERDLGRKERISVLAERRGVGKKESPFRLPRTTHKN